MALSTTTTDGMRSILAADLETDWAPDPWSWDHESLAGDLLSDATDVPIETVQAALVGGDRWRAVPLLDISTRLQLGLTATGLAWRHRDVISDGVCAYRPVGPARYESYRVEYENRQRIERAAANDAEWYLTSDLHRFFPSTTADVLTARLEYLDVDLPKPLSRVLLRIESGLGHCLPEGYSAARALANLCLVEADRAITSPFTRWVDDYRIFTKSMTEAEAQLESLDKAVSRSGAYRLSEAKSFVAPIADFPERDVGRSLSPDHSADIPDAALALDQLVNRWHETEALERERLLRHYARLGAERRDDRLSASFVEIVKNLQLPASAFPRLAWYLAANAESKRVSSLASLVVEFGSDSNWAMLRVAPALWYLPGRVASSCLGKMVETAQRQPSVAIAAARAAARHDSSYLATIVEAIPAGNGRVKTLVEWEASGRELAPPPVKTFL